MIFTTLIEPRELHAFMLNQKVSGNRNIIILDCSCSIPDPESVSSFTPRSTFRALYS